MRRNFTKGLMVGAIALAGLGSTGLAQANVRTTDPSAVTVNANSKAVSAKKEKAGAIKVNPYTGGLDMSPNLAFSDMGLTPKEYGMRYGNGKSRKGKTNYARMSHNAKVGRR